MLVGGRLFCLFLTEQLVVNSQRYTVNLHFTAWSKELPMSPFPACASGPVHYHVVINCTLVQGGLSFLLSFLSHAFLGLRMVGTDRKACFLCFQKPSISYAFFFSFKNTFSCYLQKPEKHFPFRIFFTVLKKAVFSKKLAPDYVWLKIIVACCKNDSWKQTKWAECLGRPSWQTQPYCSTSLQVRNF